MTSSGQSRALSTGLLSVASRREGDLATSSLRAGLPVLRPTCSTWSERESSAAHVERRVGLTVATSSRRVPSRQMWIEAIPLRGRPCRASIWWCRHPSRGRLIAANGRNAANGSHRGLCPSRPAARLPARAWRTCRNPRGRAEGENSSSRRPLELGGQAVFMLPHRPASTSATPRRSRGAWMASFRGSPLTPRQ